MVEELPKDILTHITPFSSDELQACDPRCYRAARCVQAAWRGWVTRFQRWRCNCCDERMFLGVKFSKHSGRVFARLLRTRLYKRLHKTAGTFTCDRCRTIQIMYKDAGMRCM